MSASPIERANLTDTVAVKLCWDCAYHQENVAPHPAYTSNSSCESHHEAGVECDHEGHAPEDFDTTPCTKCGTTLAGHRFYYAYWPDHDPDGELSARAPLTGLSERNTSWRVTWEIDVDDATTPADAARNVWKDVFGRDHPGDEDACVFTVTDLDTQESVVIDLSTLPHT